MLAGGTRPPPDLAENDETGAAVGMLLVGIEAAVELEEEEGLLSENDLIMPPFLSGGGGEPVEDENGDLPPSESDSLLLPSPPCLLRLAATNVAIQRSRSGLGMTRKQTHSLLLSSSGSMSRMRS
jgi:hypothetical protein